ncbi:MAG: hypothetical protein ACLRWC_08790 [Acutalibacter sp.]
MKRCAALFLAVLLCGVLTGCTPQPEKGQALVEEKGVKVTYTGMEMTEEGGLELTFTVENQGDKPLLLNVQEFSANGCSMAAFFASETAAGETSHAVLTIPAGELERYGLDTVEEASFSLAVFHGDTLEPILTTEQLHVDL